MINIIKLEKDDIKTSRFGKNILVEIDENNQIIFDDDALIELIDDYNQILVEERIIKNDNLENETDIKFPEVIVHPHRIVEMTIKNLKKDEVGYIAECVLYNTLFKNVESSFFIDEDKANEIIILMQNFIKTCKELN